jgi:hypothetical protein
MNRWLAIAFVVTLVGTTAFFLIYAPASAPQSSSSSPFTAQTSDTSSADFLDPAAAAAFVYQGKPIHPACLLNLEFDADPGSTSNKQYDLAECQTIEPDTKWEASKIENGYVSADATYTADAVGSAQEFDSYRVLAQKGDIFLIENDWNTGGTGDFSDVIRVQLSGNTISYAGPVPGVQGGDRCNGGVSVEGIREGALFYSVELTPFDIIALGASTTLKAYTDLESSASSCYGEANYQVDPWNQGAPVLNSVSLGGYFDATEDAPTTGEWVNSLTYEACFNRMFNKYRNSGHSTLIGSTEIKAFASDFLATCVR